MNPQSPTLVLVIGSHRAGTSATAGALATAFGVDFGSVLMPPSDRNPKGYFEDLEAVALHDHLLRLKGKSWDDPPLGCLVGGEEAAQAILRRLRAGGSPVLGLKDPRATFFVHGWQEACRREAIGFAVLAASRNPYAAAASLVERDGFSRGMALGLSQRYDALAREAAELAEFGAVLKFPHDLAQVEQWRRVESQLGIAFPRTDWPALRRWVEPELVHHG